MWRAEIKVLLKKSVLDPQGRAVENALASLGYNNVNR
ncbi:MAG: phosphoribosylformylglycinamidine synthase subunit PurS, partial [Firmicutes bacterium]|nr:phosphoribosylformylglycinamidine synthase subunit PurS [Bacillota bacterium]